MNLTKVVWKTQFGFIVIQESLDEWLLQVEDWLIHFGVQIEVHYWKAVQNRPKGQIKP